MPSKVNNVVTSLVNYFKNTGESGNYMQIGKKLIPAIFESFGKSTLDPQVVEIYILLSHRKLGCK